MTNLNEENRDLSEVFNWLIDNRAKLMNKFIYKMIPNTSDAEDFYQDLILAIVEKPLGKLLGLLDREEMDQFCYVVIRNNFQSKNSRYHYIYTKPRGLEYEAELDTRQEQDNTEKLELLQSIEDDVRKFLVKIDERFKAIEKVNPKKIFESAIYRYFFLENNTHRGISQMLDIPPTTIFNTEKRVLKAIREVFAKEIALIKKKLIVYYSL